GNLDSALIFYEEYFLFKKDLHRDYPINVSFKNGLAIAYFTLGSTHTSLGNLDSALIFYREYYVLAKGLFKDYPTNVDFKNNLAVAYFQLGSIHASLGNLDSALSFYKKDIALTEKIYEEYPLDVEFKNNLAVSFSRLGVFCLEEFKNYPKAQTYFKKAEAIWEELTRDAPHFIQFQQYLNFVRQKLLELKYTHISKLNEQIRLATDTLEIYNLYQTLSDTLRLKSSLNHQYKSQLSQALNSKAWYGFFLQKFAKNEKDIREAMKLSVKNKYLATNLAPALLLQGKYKQAEKEYLKYKDQAFEEQELATYKDAFLDDFKTFEKAGIIPEERKKDVARIKELLEK
ncbi:MAG: tetratricopeptide repeat protein, partial [Bacteroidota bacterium]